MTKRTINLIDFREFQDHREALARPFPYARDGKHLKVDTITNSTVYHVGSWLSYTQAEELIQNGWTVNLKAPKK